MKGKYLLFIYTFSNKILIRKEIKVSGTDKKNALL